FGSLIQKAKANNRRLHIPSGAIGGLDVIKAAAVDGLEECRLTTTKPPQALQDAPYVRQNGINLDTIRDATTIFEGTAKQAVRCFPQNINVAATISLAGLGLERTTVKIVADPAATRNVHEVFVRGNFGEATIRLANQPSLENPKSSGLGSFSVIANPRRGGQQIQPGNLLCYIGWRLVYTEPYSGNPNWKFWIISFLLLELEVVVFALRISLFLLTSVMLLAQDPRGSISGRVVDKSDAVVVGARVRATNVQTGVTAASASNEAGTFLIPLLVPGTYRLTVEMSGFKTFSQPALELRTGDALDLPIRLDVGDTTERVDVDAAAPILETGSSTLGQVIDERRLLELPQKGGDP